MNMMKQTYKKEDDELDVGRVVMERRYKKEVDRNLMSGGIVRTKRKMSSKRGTKNFLKISRTGSG